MPPQVDHGFWYTDYIPRSEGHPEGRLRPLPATDARAPLPGVLGAGLMGAGGGGCVLILIRDGEGVTERINAELGRHYYEPLGKPVDVERWEPVAGAGEVGQPAFADLRTRP